MLEWKLLKKNNFFMLKISASYLIRQTQIFYIRNQKKKKFNYNVYFFAFFLALYTRYHLLETSCDTYLIFWNWIEWYLRFLWLKKKLNTNIEYRSWSTVMFLLTKVCRIFFKFAGEQSMRSKMTQLMTSFSLVSSILTEKT